LLVIRDLLTISVRDPDLTLVQDHVEDWTEQVTGREILDGRLVTGQVLAIGDNTINHGLGRDLKGWIIVRSNAAGVDPYDKQASNASPELTLVLTSAAVATVDLWVF